MAHVSSATKSNRKKRKAENQEDIKHLIEEVCGFYPDENFYKIFARESRLGLDDVLVMSKEELHELSHKTKDCVAVHLTLVYAYRIRILLHCKMNLLEKYLCPDDGSFLFSSITMNDHDMLTAHPERKAFQDFWDNNKDALDSNQDYRPSPSDAHDFTLNGSYSSEIDSFSFVSKEDSFLDEDKEDTYDHSIATSTST